MVSDYFLLLPREHGTMKADLRSCREPTHLDMSGYLEILGNERGTRASGDCQNDLRDMVVLCPNNYKVSTALADIAGIRSFDPHRGLAAASISQEIAALNPPPVVQSVSRRKK